MTDSDSNQILTEMRNEMREFNTYISGELKQVNTRLEHIETRLDKVEIGQEKADAYCQGTQWVVNLSFSLIVATTIGIILRFVLAS